MFAVVERSDRQQSTTHNNGTQANLTIAITIPAKTKTTIAICIQIHVGDIRTLIVLDMPTCCID